MIICRLPNIEIIAEPAENVIIILRKKIVIIMYRRKIFPFNSVNKKI